MPSLSECSYNVTPPSVFMACPQITLLSFLFLFRFIITACSLISSYFFRFRVQFYFSILPFHYYSLPLFLASFRYLRHISKFPFFVFIISFSFVFVFLTLICCLFSSSFSFISLVPCVFLFYSFRPSFLQLFLKSMYLTTLSFTRIHCGAVR